MKDKKVRAQKVTCRQCSRCCKYFCVQIDEPETMEELDDYAWIIAHEGASIHIDGHEWYLYMKSRCKYLGENGTCGIYERRPAICRAHTPGECEINSDHELDYDDADTIITDMDKLYEFGRDYITGKSGDKQSEDCEDDDERQ